MGDLLAPNPFGAVNKVAKGFKISGKVLKNVIKKLPFEKLPENVQDVFNKYNNHKWQGNYPGQPQGGTASGAKWDNRYKRLPTEDKHGNPITYKEYDINPKIGTKRDAQRILKSSDDKFYYTDSHYGHHDHLDKNGLSKNGLPDFVEITDINLKPNKK